MCSSDLHQFKVIGHILSRNDDNDCIGIIMASQYHEIIIVVCNVKKGEIYISDITKHNYPIIGKKDINSLLSVVLPENMVSEFILQLSSDFKILNNATSITQKVDRNYLSVVMGNDVKVSIASKNSHLPLGANEFYSFKYSNYILTYEQPCLVRIIRGR